MAVVLPLSERLRNLRHFSPGNERKFTVFTVLKRGAVLLNLRSDKGFSRAGGIMKLLGCIPTLVILGLCLVQSAWSDIYVYSADNGTVTLSNVPANNHYALLLPAPQEAVPAAGIRKPSWNPANKVQYDRIVAEIARTYGLDSALLHAVISVESHYSPKAVSRKGAMGLMQLMPETARRYGVTDSFDPVQNLHGGARHLQYLLKMFNNDISLALAAYNAGEGSVVKYGNRIPPFRETTNYVPQVLGFYQRYQAGLL